jgi:hypothetical protein
MEEIKNKFADLIMKHGAPLTLAVAFMIYMDYKDNKHEQIYLKAISGLKKEKQYQMEYNKDLVREVIECYKLKE